MNKSKKNVVVVWALIWKRHWKQGKAHDIEPYKKKKK